MRSIASVILAACGAVHAQGTPPIIDMHVHAEPLAWFEQLGGPAPIPHCVPMTDYPPVTSARRWTEAFRTRDQSCHAVRSPSTDDEVMQGTLAIMKRRNVIAVTSGALA
jgi:hypothetical protein